MSPTQVNMHVVSGKRFEVFNICQLIYRITSREIISLVHNFDNAESAVHANWHYAFSMLNNAEIYCNKSQVA